MANNGATGYSLKHLQVAAKGSAPVYKDVNYATKAEFTINQDNQTFQADGAKVVTTFSAREGQGSIGFGSADLSTIAIMTGDVFSTTGAAGSKVDRLELKGGTTPPSIILSAWIPNVDGNSLFSGMRITAPNAKVAVPTASFEQENWTEWSADLTYSADEHDTMLIWENVEVAPTFTDGVMPVSLTAV